MERKEEAERATHAHLPPRNTHPSRARLPQRVRGRKREDPRGGDHHGDVREREDGAVRREEGQHVPRDNADQAYDRDVLELGLQVESVLDLCYNAAV